MPNLPQKPAYQPRNVDQHVIEFACQWHVNPKAGSEKAGFIGLKGSPDSGASDLLRNVTSVLAGRGFKAIYVDAARNHPNEVPSALAAALHEEFARSPLRVLAYKFRELWNCSWRRRLLQILIILIVSVGWLLPFFLVSPWHKPPYVQNFLRHFLLENFGLQLFNLLGATTIIQLVLASSQLGELPFDEVAEERFSSIEGYLRAMSDIHRRAPIALVVDNGGNLSQWPEIAVLNALLNLDVNPKSAPGLPHGFRILVIILNPSPGLMFAGKTESFIEIPELQPQAISENRNFEEKITDQINRFLSESVATRKAGVISSTEWTAFEAELGRPTSKPEREELYAEVTTSDLLPSLGLVGKHPAKSPKTVFHSLLAKSREVLYPIYSRLVSTFYQQHQMQNVLARARLMLTIRGLACVRRSEHWRTWDPKLLRTLLAAANHAEDLAFSDAQGTSVIDLLESSIDERRKLLAELILILVTASEIKKAMGHLRRAADFLQAVTQWYTDAQPVLEESLQNRLFYGLWDCFWLSCDKEQRDSILKFEREHPAVREINTWKVLKNYERRNQGKILIADVEDPGPTMPELGNLYQFTQLRERLMTLHAYEFDAAADDATFDIGTIYQEPYFSYTGLYLESIRSHLLCKRNSSTSAQDDYERKLNGFQSSIPSVFCGDRLIIDCEILSQPSYRPWLTKDPDVEAVLRDRTGIINALLGFRRFASVMGFGEVIRQCSYNLGFLTAFSREELFSLGTLRQWPEAERFYQEVLDIEARLGWALRTVDIYQLRIRLQSADSDVVVDDSVALYDAAKKARYPSDVLNSYLNSALALSANHASNDTHRQYCAELHELAAQMTMAGTRDESFWTMKNKEEEVVHSLFFAASRRMILGDLESASRLGDEAEAIARQAEAARPGSEGVRESWLNISLLRMQLAIYASNAVGAQSWCAKCWGAMRASDVNAAFIFRTVLAYEDEQSILSLPSTLETSRKYQGEILSQDFSPAPEELNQFPPDRTLFDWRLAEFIHVGESLKPVNMTSYFETVLTFASICELSGCSTTARDRIVELLLVAEKYFADEDPSNSDQRRCLQYIQKLDPSRTAEIEERLQAIAEEDSVLKQREQTIADVIRNTGTEATLQDVDNEFMVSKLGRHGRHLVDACRNLIVLAESAFSQGEYADTASWLGRHARQWRPARASWARLRLTHLWVFALLQLNRPEPVSLAKRLLATQIDQLLDLLLPETVKDRRLLEEYRSELQMRLDEAFERRFARFPR